MPATVTEGLQIDLAAGHVRRVLGGLTPRVALVLGSGLGSLAASVVAPLRIPYRDVPGLTAPTTPGHEGEFVVGQLERVPVILQNGRFHLYEGHDPAMVVLPLRLCAELGASILVVTNAAGGLNPRFTPPSLMLIADHINYMWCNPLSGPVVQGEHRWPDMNRAFDLELRQLARRVARDRGVELNEGVYAAVLGPSYETPAEVRMLQRIGADAVGMSTVPEVITARARGMRVLGIAAITNAAAGLENGGLTHKEVLEGANRVARQLEHLICGMMRTIAV
ncbi:MAG: purine-nucleoside phosphorylase [Gemmatimonadota bacterium]|nr:MAG: purine-nucleoside phosphorylase [Gemmatimonadota bacterium]